MFPLSGIVHKFFSFLFFLSVLVACHRAPRSVPDDKVLDNQSDTNTDKTRALVQGCRYLDTFWPASQVPLEESAWVDSCTTKIIEELGDDNFVTIRENPNAACVVCSANGECIQTICNCPINGATDIIYCNNCFFSNLANGDLSCCNSSQCEKLMPYQIIRRAMEGGVFDSIAGNIADNTTTAPRTFREEEEAHQRIDRALLFASEGPKRYLTKLVEALNTNEDAFSIVACGEKSCAFQALAEKNCVSVPCYFHNKRLICVQCSGKWKTHHRCPENRIFKNIEERREARAFPCPNCNVPTQHTEGCMHMTCTQCKHHWCWYCVFHFYGLGEHENKTQAYSTEAEYKQRHCQPFHNGALFHYRNTNAYLRHCNLGAACACRRTSAF